MQQASMDRPEFLPQPTAGGWQAFVLAVAAHVVLVLALTLGLRWTDSTTLLSAEAELWSATPQQAAPKPVEAPPPPPPPPTPRAQPAPPPPVPQKTDADIAVERERERKRLAEDKARQERAERERVARLEAQKEREKAERERAEARRQELAQRKRDEERRAREQAQAKEREAQEAERTAQLREENLRRIQGLAGATGAPSATGTAQRSAGPSDSYAGRIRARVKPNIVFADDVPGNPSTEVEVRMAPDGTITSRRITKSSGVKSWDEAVLRALDRTEVLPRDTDGRVHTPLLMEFRPKG